MQIIYYDPKKHKQIIKNITAFLKQGMLVVYPTDTSYGLAADAMNKTAVSRLYKVKGRKFNKPVHVIVSSVLMAKRLIFWNKCIEAWTEAFWPGPLTIVAKTKVVSRVPLDTLTAGTGFLGVRMPGNSFALGMVLGLGRPVTATSANVSGMPDCYSIEDVITQFRKKINKPDILIDTGRLPRTNPSTVVKVVGNKFEVIRNGPIANKQIKDILRERIHDVKV